MFYFIGLIVEPLRSEKVTCGEARGEGERRRSERASFLKGRRRRVCIWLWGQEKRGAWWCGDGVRAVLCVYIHAHVLGRWRRGEWVGEWGPGEEI